MKPSLVTAAGLGAASGLRSLQALAWVSRDLSSRRLPRRASRIERWLAGPGVARVLAGLAAGELAGDKLPGIPDRTAVPPLVGRALAGAVVGAIAAGRDRQPVGAAVGAATAVAATYAGWYIRRELGRVTPLPDAVVALAEDALAVALARRFVDGA